MSDSKELRNEKTLAERKEFSVRWKAFKAKKKLAFGLILFHLSSVSFWLLATNFIPERNIRIEIVSFWGLSIAGIVYVLVVAAPLMIKKIEPVKTP